MATDNYALAFYQKAQRWPFGQWFFTRYIASRAPYFKSIRPKIMNLKAGYCSVKIPKRKAVQNHIGTVHVIAACNGLEMAMGVMAEASIPKHLRWIPKGMEVNYVSKGTTDLICVAQLDESAWQVGDVIIPVVASDTQGVAVVEGSIRLWVTEKPVK